MPDGEYKRASIATKKYIQNVITQIYSDQPQNSIQFSFPL